MSSQQQTLERLSKVSSPSSKSSSQIQISITKNDSFTNNPFQINSLPITNDSHQIISNTNSSKSLPEKITRQPSAISPVFLGSHKKRKKAVKSEKRIRPSTQELYLDVPMEVVCIYCGQIDFTETRLKNSFCNWLVCTGIAFSGCFCGCCLVPFCVGTLKDVEHVCGVCNSVLGLYKI